MIDAPDQVVEEFSDALGSYARTLHSALEERFGLNKIKKGYKKLPPLIFDPTKQAHRITSYRTAMRNALQAARTAVASQVREKLNSLGKADNNQHDLDLDWKTAELISNGLDLGDLSVMVDELATLGASVAGETAFDAIGQIGYANNSEIVNQIDTRAAQWAKDRAAELVGMRYNANRNLVPSANAEMRIDETTRNAIREDIFTALQEGDTTETLVNTLTTGYTFSDARASLIANTEIARAHSEGALIGYRAANEAGTHVMKYWEITDEACDDCEENEADGAIELDDTFSSGDDAPPAHPNCRCAIVPYVEDLESFSAPGDLAKDFNPDQPRDDRGRWAAGEIAGAYGPKGYYGNMTDRLRNAQPLSDEEKDKLWGKVNQSKLEGRLGKGDANRAVYAIAAHQGSTHSMANNPEARGAFDKAFEKCSVKLERDTVLWRGLSLDQKTVDKFHRAIGKNSSMWIDQKADRFVPTSSEKHVGESFASNVLLRVVAPAGTRVFPASAVTQEFQSERELTLDRGTRFRVAYLSEQRGQMSVVTVQVVRGKLSGVAERGASMPKTPKETPTPEAINPAAHMGKRSDRASHFSSDFDLVIDGETVYSEEDGEVTKPWDEEVSKAGSDDGVEKSAGIPTVFVCRHGSTDYNQGGVGKDRIRGHLDVPLDERGEREAVQLAYRLREFPVTMLYASDLRRTVATAEAIAAHHTAKVDKMPALRSWNLGDMQGKKVDDEVVRQIKEYVRSPDRVPSGGESFSAFMQRFLDAAANILEIARGSPSEDFVIVSHARNVQLIELWTRSGHSISEMTRQYAEDLASEPDTVAPGGFIRLQYRAGQWEVTGSFLAQDSDRTHPVS